MILLDGCVFFEARHSISQGLPDFSIFYTAGRILREGNGARLYDDSLQEELQRSFSPQAIKRRGSILPYNHPPFEAVLFIPLVGLSYLGAYLVWSAVNLALVCGLLLLLRRRLTALGQAPLYFWFLGCLAFYPIFFAVIQGQDSILLLFCYCMAFVSLRKPADFAAGSWLGLGLYKYHLVLPFVFPLLWRKRLLAGFAAVAAILGVLSLAVTGWRGLVSYPRYVWATEHDVKYVWNAPHGNTANLRGMISALVPGRHPGLETGLLLIASAIVLMMMVSVGRRVVSADRHEAQMAFALILAGTVLLSYHTYVHDLSPLFLSVVLALETLLSGPPVPNSKKTALYICMAVMFCSPIYLLLILRYSQLQVMAGVVLIFFLVLLGVLKAPRGQSVAAVSPRA